MKKIAAKRIIVFGLLMCFLMPSYIFSQSFFEEISIPDTTEIKCLAHNSNGDVFIGVWDDKSYYGGILRKLKGETSWMSVCNEFPNLSPLSIDIASNGVIYVGSSNADYYCIKSENNGDSWEIITLPGTNNIVAIETVGVDSLIFGRNPAEPIVVHSTDNGMTWACDTVTMITNNYITDFEVFEGELYASMYCISQDHGGIYKSVDFGNSWEFDGLLDHQVFSMAFNSKGDLFTGDFGACSVPSNLCGIYYKKNGEEVYEHIIETMTVRDIVITKQDYVFFSTDFWVYGTSNYGQTIDTIFDPLGLYMEHLSIDPDGYMWGANGIRLIKSLEPVSFNGVGIEENNIERHLLVYPNPATESVSVHLVNVGDDCCIIVCDLYGEVCHHIDAPCSNIYHFDISSFPMGIYFIHVLDGNYTSPLITKFLKL